MLARWFRPILFYYILSCLYSVMFLSFSNHFLNVRVLSCPSYSILFSSILFYSSLFYSILFYPILSYSYSTLFYSILLG